MIQSVTAVAVVLAWAGALVFCGRYLLTRWFDTPMGWHAMTFMVIALELLSLAAAREVFGAHWPGRDWVRAVAYYQAAAVIWWRVALLFSAQARGRRRRRARAGVGAMMTGPDTEEAP